MATPMPDSTMMSVIKDAMYFETDPCTVAIDTHRVERDTARNRANTVIKICKTMIVIPLLFVFFFLVWLTNHDIITLTPTQSCQNLLTQKVPSAISLFASWLYCFKPKKTPTLSIFLTALDTMASFFQKHSEEKKEERRRKKVLLVI